MGLLDSLAGAAMGSGEGQGGSLLQMASQLLQQSGGLQNLLGKLQSGGLSDAVASWVGTGANQAVSGEQISQALGGDLLGQLAQQFGGNAQAAAGGLADVLPGLIDKLTPDGQLPADGGANALQSLLGGQAGDLMGMVGGLLKR